MRELFVKNSVWSEGKRPDCMSVSFGQSNESVDRLKEIVEATLSKKWESHANGTSSQASNTCQGFSIPLGEEPLLPAWAKRYKFMRDGEPDFGIYIAVFDLAELTGGNVGDAKKMIVVAQLADGYPDESGNVKRGKKATKFFKKEIAKHCEPWDEETDIQDALTEEYELEKAKHAMTSTTKGMLIALGAAAGKTLLKILIDKYGDDSAEGEMEALLEEFPDISSITEEIPDEVRIPIFCEPPQDGVERGSATQLGRLIGMTGREFNEALHEKGYLDGKPGDWRVTEKGAPYAILRSETNGYGGYAYRAWEWLMWDKSIVSEVGDPIAHLNEVNETRASCGMPPLDKLG